MLGIGVDLCEVDRMRVALERTNNAVAPWYVIPADKKWFRNLAVGELLLQTLSRSWTSSSAS